MPTKNTANRFETGIVTIGQTQSPGALARRPVPGARRSAQLADVLERCPALVPLRAVADNGRRRPY